MTDADQAPEGYEELYQSVENQHELVIASQLEKNSRAKSNDRKTKLNIKPLEMENFIPSEKNPLTFGQ
jgi:hypothetical protein